MKNIILYAVIFSLGFIHLSCKEEVEIPITPCNEILDGWNITSYSFPKVQAQNDMFFLNDEVGFSVGNSATILKTEDGGQTWRFLHYYRSLETGTNPDAITGAIFDAVYFINDSVGFVGGHNFIVDTEMGAVFLRTIDGGNSWTKEYLNDITEIKDFLFFDELNGLGLFLVKQADSTYHNQVRRTIDGGMHWDEISLTGAKLESNSFVTTPARICFVASRGWNKNELWSSDDKGLTWKLSALPDDVVQSIYFVNDQFGYANCTPVNIPSGNFQTRDGGVTWMEVETPFTGWSVIHFANDLEGFVIDPVYDYFESGGEGYSFITAYEGFQTSDGGVTWDKSVVKGNCEFDAAHHLSGNNNLYMLDYPVFTRFEKH